MRTMIVNAAKKAVSGIKSLARKVTNAVVKAAVSFKDFIKSIIGKAKSLFKGKAKDEQKEVTATVTDLSNPEKNWTVLMETKVAERKARGVAFDPHQKERTEGAPRKPVAKKRKPQPQPHKKAMTTRRGRNVNIKPKPKA